MLKSCMAVAGKLKEHCYRLNSLGITTGNQKVINSIGAYANDIEVHQQNTRVLIDNVQGTSDLVGIHLLHLSHEEVNSSRKKHAHYQIAIEDNRFSQP